jgi:hydrogenase/urease accessory protein HupE
MASEAEHSNVHRAAAADHRDVPGHVAVDQCAALFDERALLFRRQIPLQVERAFTELHTRYVIIAPVKRLGLAAALVAAAMLGLPPAASAHPIPFSYLDLRLQSDAIEGTLVAHIYDVAHDLRVEPMERLLDPVFIDNYRAAIIVLLGRGLEVAADGQVLTPVWSDPEILTDRQSLRVRVRFNVERPPGTVAVAASLFPYDPVHQTFVNIYEGDALTQAILDRSKARFEYYPGNRQGIAAVVRRFVPAGVHHILIGPDHLLFLVGLLLLGGTMRRLGLVVTAFTVAHSITLSLAALNIVNPSPRIIEPAIALSIVFVGVDNLLVRGGRDVRTWIAFAFGFIHGFGFANVLREMDLPPRALGWSLFSFNLGVEIGQLIVVILVASLFALIRARSEAAGRRLLVVGSIVVVAAGAFWFFQRVFFPAGIA